MRTKVRGGLLVLMAASLVMVGCTRRFYREGADNEVAEVLSEKNCYPQWAIQNFHVYPDPRARFADPTNPDRPPMPPDDPAAWDLSPHPQKPPKQAGIRLIEGQGYLDYLAACTAQNRAEDAAKAKPSSTSTSGAVETAEPPQPKPDQPTMPAVPSPTSPAPAAAACPPYKLKLEQAVELGLFNSREYQDAREQLYLSALPVTLERFSFASQFLAAGEIVRHWAGTEASPGAGNLWLADSSLGFSKLFPTGALLLFRLANSLTINLDKEPKVVATGDASLQLAQPLLRGGGKAVTLEPLTLSERNLLYQIRSYARFRKEFFVAIAGGGEFTQSRTGFPGGGTLSSTNPFAFGQGVNSLNTVNLGPAGIILGGSSVPADASAPTQGYLPTILQGAFVENDRQNIAQFQRFLKRFQATLAGGDISQLQVDQIHQQLLRGESQLLNDELTWRNGLDFLKLQLGIPTEVALELDDEVLVPIRRHVARFLDVIAQTTDLRDEVEGAPAREGRPARPGYGQLSDVGLLRGRLRRQLTDSLLTRGTNFAQTILGLWARWEKMTPQARTAELRRLTLEKRKLEDERDKAETEGRPLPPVQAQRLEDVTSDIALGSFEESLALYESRDWQRRQPGARNLPGPEEQTRLHLALFRRVVNDFEQVVTKARNERFERLRASWPSPPPIVVEGVDLLGADLDQAQTVAGRYALNNRLDLLNARAQLVDFWRQIAIQANSLLGALNLRYNQDSFTPPGKDQPFSFSGSRTTHEITLNGELPLVRRLERNNYRTALIAYQRERRVLQATEDFVLSDVRSELRQLRVFAENYRIQQQQLELGITQVEASLDAFNQPSLPTGATTVGTIATSSSAGAGNAAALTLQLINAQSSLLQAQDGLFQVWINYLVFRMQLYRDLELMPLDPRGVWIDESASLPTASPNDRGGAAAGPGNVAGPAPERLPEPRRQPNGGRPGQPGPQPAPPPRP